MAYSKMLSIVWHDIPNVITISHFLILYIEDIHIGNKRKNTHINNIAKKFNIMFALAFIK